MDKNALSAVFSEASNSGWSLRSDVQLQEWLERFAERLKERTELVVREVQQLGAETDVVELNLKNTFNRLRALSATQFIEHRVDEEDESTTNRSEPDKQPRAENYDSQIIPRYKEAVLTAWNAFEGFNSSKTVRPSSDADRALGPSTRAPMKLPHIIGTDEFARESHCGLADSSFTDRIARASSSEPAESDSDTDRDEARMAAEMVGGGIWLEGEWSATESEASGHQGGVLEPAVSAALDFKAMLEAALRGPSLPYEDGIPNLQNAYGQYSYMDNAPTLWGQAKGSNTPRIRTESGKSKLDGESPAASGQNLLFPDFQRDGSYLEDYMDYHDQGGVPKAPVEAGTTNSVQPSPADMQPPAYGNDFAEIAAALTSKALPNQIQTPDSSSSPDRYPVNPVSSYGESSRSELEPQVTTSAVKTQNMPVPPSLSPRFRDNENNPLPPPSQPRPLVINNNPPMPTLPNGLFQGLQAAIQARENRSLSNRENTEKKVIQKPAVVVKEKAAGRPSWVRPNLKDNVGTASNNGSEASLKPQKGPTMGAGTVAGFKAQRTISFRGGLFDDDDEDDNVNISGSKDVSEKPKDAVAKTESQRDPTGMSPTFSRITSRHEPFDDSDEVSTGPATESEAAKNFESTERITGSQRPFPPLQDGNRTSVVVRSEADLVSDVHEAVQEPHSSLSHKDDELLRTKMEFDMASTSAEAVSHHSFPSLQDRQEEPGRPVVVSSEEDSPVKVAQEPHSTLSRQGSIKSSTLTKTRIDKASTFTKDSRQKPSQSRDITWPQPSKCHEEAPGLRNRIGDPELSGKAGHSMHSRERKQDSAVSPTTAEISVMPGENAMVAVSSSTDQAMKDSIVSVGDKVDIVKDAQGTVTGSTSRVLTASANRNPVLSDSDDDTSLSWTNSESEESSTDNEKNSSKGARKQESGRAVARSVTAEQQSHISRSSDMEDDDGEKSTPVSQNNVGVSTSKVAEVSKHNGNRLDAADIRVSTALISLSSWINAPANAQTGADIPSASLQQRAEPDLSLHSMPMGTSTTESEDPETGPLRYISPLPGKESARSKKQQVNPSAAMNGSSHSLTASVEATIASMDTPTQGRSGKDGRASTAGEAVPTVAARRFRSLFDDDDEEDEDLFLPRPQATQALSATHRRVGRSEGSNLFSSGTLNSPLASSPSDNRLVGGATSRPATASTTSTPDRMVLSSDFRQEKPSQLSGRSTIDETIRRSSPTSLFGQRENSTTRRLFEGPERSLSASHGTEAAVSSPVAKATEYERKDTPSPSSTAKTTRRTVSALLFGDDDDDGGGGEDALFGPLGGRQTRVKSASLLGGEGTTGGESSRRSVSARLPLASPLRGSRTPDSSSQTPRRSLFDDDAS